jgi:transglutaminase-like putative cysteine protease
MAVATGTNQVQATESPSVSPHDRLARAGGWWAFLLTFVMLGSVAEAVHATAWSDGLGVVRLAIMGGGLVGLALALTRFDSAFATIYGIVMGVFWVALSLQRVLLPDMATHDAVQEVLLRNAGWLATLLQGGRAADNLVFVTQLGFLGWWLGFFAAWQIFRHQRVLYAVVPAGAALLVNLYYSPVNLSGYLLVFLVATLLIAVRLELSKNEMRWQITRVRYAPDIYIDFLKAGLAFAVIVVLVSWAMPDVASRANLERLGRPFDRPWKSVEDTWSRMYQSLNYPGVVPTVNRYGSNLALGGPVSLSDRPIFEGQFPERTYWRATTYDFYDGRGWTDTNQEIAIVEQGQWLGEPLFGATAEMTATMRLLESGQDVILSPPQPVRISVPVDADFSRITDDGELVSVSRISSRVDVNSRLGYKVASAVTQASLESLRADGATYPAWVTARYLQLPASLPSRVVELAKQLTAPYDNEFDRASAIESYLRRLTYNTDIAAPPEGRDAVDYFLFDIQEGYCDYFASAMAVMLRSVGIPSRLAAGYAPGELLASQDDKPLTSDTYRVLERDAHAWVEAFFPTYGWIQFEPTAAQPRVQRPVVVETTKLDPTPTPAVDDEDLRDLRNLSSSDTSPLVAPRRSAFVEWMAAHRATLIGLLALLFVTGTLIFVARWRRQAFLRSPELLSRLLGLVGAWASRLGIPWPLSDTPLERAARFSQQVPQAEPVVTTMTGLFVAQRYGRQNPSADAVQSTAREWEIIQPKLWQEWLRRALPRRSTSRSASPTPAGRGRWRSDPDLDLPPGTSQRRR